MTFEQLVDRMVAEFDVTQARAVQVANERLDMLLARSEGQMYRKTIGTTTSGTSTYSLSASVVSLKRVRIDFTAGTMMFEGTGMDAMDDLDAGLSTYSGVKGLFAILPNTDDDSTTADLRLYPAPSESGKTILGIYAGIGSDLTYGTSTALPITEDLHEGLASGCRAELARTEEGAQDPAEEGDFQAAIAGLKKRVKSRGAGSGSKRISVRGYDFR